MQWKEELALENALDVTIMEGYIDALYCWDMYELAACQKAAEQVDIELKSQQQNCQIASTKREHSDKSNWNGLERAINIMG